MKSKNNSVDSELLPVRTVFAIIGPFSTIASVVFVITQSYLGSSQYLLNCLVIESTILLILVFITFFIIGIKNYSSASEFEAYNTSLACLRCIKEKMNDGFHNRGLLYLDELITFERKLSSVPEPSKCKVVIYTSDLATENNVENDVKNNISSGVRYIILYFANTCTDEEYKKIKGLYGENNLINLSKRDDYANSFDGKHALTLGFDCIVYNVGENIIKGYFAVDFVPINRPYRACHIPNCQERCNYGKEDHQPFYKEISTDIAKQIYDEGFRIRDSYYN